MSDWYLRILPGVRKHFRPRWPEWVMAWWLIVWGGNMLLNPGDDFVTPQGSFNGLAYWFGHDYVFCSIMVAVGAAQILALTINGTFHDTIYARYSPLVRAGAAFLGCGIWMMIWLSCLAVGTQGQANYWAPALINGLLAYFVGGESGDVLGMHRYGRRGK